MGESSEQTAPFKFEIKDAPNARASALGAAADVQDATGNPPLQAFRFKVQVKGGPQPAVIAVAQAGLEVFELQWQKQDLEHGSETLLSARIRNYDQKPVRFVIEFEKRGRWEPYAQVQARVKDGKAEGTLRVHHPLLPPTGSLPSAATVQAAEPANLRFSLERGEAEVRPAAEPSAPVPASTQPRTHAKVQTGTLTIKGALAGQAFFIVSSRTHRPVKVGEGSKVKTATTAAGGVMFILGRDRTATFEKLPAGHYRVVFPPEQVEGEKPAQPVIKSNAHGAHVVDIKDFVHQGAVCEIEVPEGGAPTLELTLSADGTAQVCC